MILREIDARIAALAESLAPVIQQDSAALSARLNARVTAVLADWSAERKSLPGKQAGAQLGALTVRLRSGLEQDFLTAFHDALNKITALSLDAEQALRKQMAAAEAVLETSIFCPELPAVKSSPSMAALGDPVATDVSGLMQGRLGGALASQEKLDAMQAIVAAEFAAIAEKLTNSAGEELRRATGFILDQMRATLSHALRTIMVERQSLLALAAASPQRDGLRRPSQAEQEKSAALARLSEELATAAVTP